MIAHVLGQPFLLRALAGGIMLALLGGYLGVFVVQRGLSFLGDGLAHAAFGGVALALLLGAEPLWVAVPFTVVVALAITAVRQRTRLGADTAVGIFFSVSMALGVIFLSLKHGYAADAFTFLFGSILAVSPADLWTTVVVLALTIAALRLWGRWAYATFDRELAMLDGIRAAAGDYLLAAAIAVTVVAGVKLVGIVLVTAFLVIPAAAARLVSPSLGIMTLAAVALGVLSVVGGLALSYRLDLPSGATIILAQAALFFGVMLVARAASAARRRTPPG